MALGSSPEHRVLARVLLWLVIGDLISITSCEVQMLYAAELIVEMSIYAELKPYIQQAIFNLKSTKHKYPPLSFT